jgi:hypothetical protein
MKRSSQFSGISRQQALGQKIFCHDDTVPRSNQCALGRTSPDCLSLIRTILSARAPCVASCYGRVLHDNPPPGGGLKSGLTDFSQFARHISHGLRTIGNTVSPGALTKLSATKMLGNLDPRINGCRASIAWPLSIVFDGGVGGRDLIEGSVSNSEVNRYRRTSW